MSSVYIHSPCELSGPFIFGPKERSGPFLDPRPCQVSFYARESLVLLRLKFANLLAKFCEFRFVSKVVHVHDAKIGHKIYESDGKINISWHAFIYD
jgi:hypothetical protein